MENYFCKVFINTLMSKDELAYTIGEFLQVSFNEILFAKNNCISLDIRKNKEVDKEQLKLFPDGFLFFPYFLEIDIVDETNAIRYKKLVGELLLFLWSKKCQIVTASDFEEELPHKGGYNQQINY